jgi:predicted metal-dependent hydrolase
MFAMSGDALEYDPRYLAGILFFNSRDFFEAHEVWEDLWQTCDSSNRRFYQALIQAAVALYHFGNGNLRGAAKLFESSRNYMNAYGSPYLGLDCNAFWTQMEHCFEGVRGGDPDRDLRPCEQEIPVITLDPAPESWPDATAFLEPEE